MNTRNLAYTAVTRAKKYLIIYGDSTKVFLGTPQKFGTKKLSRLLN
jgi:ATP-dependent exoDNAse (exonuclease V) alpha subunit